jgi:MFS transporter, DHA2 family, multidrug resistance protein
VLSLAAVLGVIYGIKQLAEFGLSWTSLAGFACGLGLSVVFIRRQGRLADPMIDLSLFRNAAFNAALAINLAGILFMFGSFMFIAQYFQLGAGLTPLQAGLWSLPAAITFTVASFVTPSLVNRFTPAQLIIGGMLLAALGFIGLAMSRELVPIVASSIVFSIGFTPVIALTTGLIVGSAPPERTGAASAMSETSAELGGALGIALLGSLGTAIYRTQMARVALDGASAQTLEAARSTLGGALAATGPQPTGQAAVFLAQAREAFMSGFQAASVLSIAGMLLCAVIAFRFLRKVVPAAH